MFRLPFWELESEAGRQEWPQVLPPAHTPAATLPHVLHPVSWPGSPFLSFTHISSFPKSRGRVLLEKVIRKKIFLHAQDSSGMSPSLPNHLIALSSFPAPPWAILSTEEQQRGRDPSWWGVNRAGGNWGWGSRVRLPPWEQSRLEVGGGKERG